MGSELVLKTLCNFLQIVGDEEYFSVVPETAEEQTNVIKTGALHRQGKRACKLKIISNQ